MADRQEDGEMCVIYFQVALYSCVSEPVQTITMDDLIPLVTTGHAVIKIDIQGSEINAFNSKTASKFFDKINVPVIQMEWGLYPRAYPYNDPVKRGQVEDWLEMFYRRKYTFFGAYGGKALGRDWENWPYDILLKRNTSPAYNVPQS